MNQSEIGTQNQSPQRFSRLNQSNQLLPDDFVLQPSQISPRVDPPKLGIKKTLFLRDNTRKKLVGCNIYVYEMDPIQLAASKRGRYCRICMNDEETSRFIHPCQCKGSSKYVHEECLKMWILQKNGIEKVLARDVACEICQQKFSMNFLFQDTIIKSRISEVPRHSKVCWGIEIFITILLIAGAALLGSMFGLENIAIDAVITLLCVIALVLICYFVASVVQHLTVEMIVSWHFQNYHSHASEYQIGTILTIPIEEKQPGYSRSPSPRGSPKAKRKSIVPNFGGIQVIQFNQLPYQV